MDKFCRCNDIQEMELEKRLIGLRDTNAARLTARFSCGCTSSKDARQGVRALFADRGKPGSNERERERKRKVKKRLGAYLLGTHLAQRTIGTEE